MSSRITFILLVLLCIPLFFLNVKSTHDWGDDFAGYIHQAKNIVEGIPQTETGYIYNTHFPTLAPKAYPAGFPLLLSPVYAIWGISIYHFSILISAFLIAFSFLMFYYLKKFFTPLTSLLLTIIFIYNPWTLSFKAEITSDFAFSFFLLLIVILYNGKTQSLYRSLLIAFLAGYLISIRNIGIVFPIAVMLELFKNITGSGKEIKKKILHSLTIVAGSFLIYFISDKLLFRISAGGLFPYEIFLNPNELINVVQTNFAYYLAVLRAFFEPWNDKWQFISIISGTMIFSFIILGIIKTLTGKISFTEILLFVYLAVIAVYPYSNAGFRFLLPLTPFLLYYLVIGMNSININLKMRTSYLAICLTIFVLFSYQKSITDTIKNNNKEIEGPLTKVNLDAFKVISEQVPRGATVDFIKPRALSLFATVNSMSHNPQHSADEIHKNLNDYGADYLLINSVITDKAAYEFLEKYGSNFQSVWSNEQNTLYKRR